MTEQLNWTDWCQIFVVLTISDIFHLWPLGAHVLTCWVVSDFWDTMDWCLLSVRGVFQAKILEQVAISSFKGPSWLRDWTCVSYASWIASTFFKINYFNWRIITLEYCGVTHWVIWPLYLSLKCSCNLFRPVQVIFLFYGQLIWDFNDICKIHFAI